MPLNNKIIKNILVVRNDRFGEFLLNIPAMRALKESFPNARITAITDPYVKNLASCIPFIDEIIPWGSKPHAFRECLGLALSLYKKHFDLAVILNPTREMHWITALAGIPVRTGYNRKWGFLLTRRMEDKKHLGQKHEIEYNLELVGLAGAKTANIDLSLNINDDIIREADKILGIPAGQTIVAVHPWTSDPVKQWPTANFLELAEKLAADPHLKVIIIGGKEEAARSAALFKNTQSPIIDITGRTSLPQLAAVLKRCALLISCDSGPVHLAGASGTRVLAIFRNDLPGKTASRWGPSGKNAFVVEKNSLENITVDEILNKARKALSA